MQYSFHSLQNKLLLASPSIEEDLYFYQSVIYLHEHDDKGSIGFIINKPSKEIELIEILTDSKIKENSLKLNPDDYYNPVFLGGPCASKEVFLAQFTHQDKKLNLKLLTPKEALVQLHKEKTLPKNFFFFSGYAAWKTKQLEDEIKENLWFLSDPMPQIFETPYENRWSTAIDLNGIDIHKFIDVIGHD
jgi:putative transcriptional regulator